MPRSKEDQIADALGGLSIDIVILSHPTLTEQDRLTTIRRMSRQIDRLKKLVGMETPIKEAS